MAYTKGYLGGSLLLLLLSRFSCVRLWDPIDRSPPGSPVPGILQARTLEWVAISSPMHESEKWKWSCSVVSDSSWSHGLQSTRLLHPWDFPGKSTGVCCHCLLLRWIYFSFFLLPFTSFLFSAICKASSDGQFCLPAFLFPWAGFDHCLLNNTMNLRP